MLDRVKYEIIDGVVDVRFICSEKMNVLDDVMFVSFIEIGDEFV